MKHDLIIFDCDGTLVDSERAYNECTIDILASAGVPRYPLDYAYREWLGKAFNDIIDFEARKNGLVIDKAAMIQKFVDDVAVYQEKYIKPIEGALDAVKILASGYKICVASNGERPNIIRSLHSMGYGEIFADDKIFSKDDVPRGKPFPDLFLHACEKMGGKPATSIVIEDSLTGVKAGRAAGMYVIGFSASEEHELSSQDALLQAGADIVFNDWRNILLHIQTGI